MKSHFIIYGYGAMGSAMAHHLYSNHQSVSVTPSPYDNLNNIPSNLMACKPQASDHVIHIISTSHKGINWCLSAIEMNTLEQNNDLLILTKGLVIDQGAIRTISDYIKKTNHFHHVCCLTGPCIANEMMQGEPASVVISSENHEFMSHIQRQIQTSNYSVQTCQDMIGHQWAAALKNIYAILINAQSAYSFTTQENLTAALFYAVHHELSEIIARVGGKKETAYSLSGIGDIWVTCRKGRNGKFGHHWGTSPLTPAQINSAIFNNTTVEGYMLAIKLESLWQSTAHLCQFPIISHTLSALAKNQPFSVLHSQLANYL